jgi:hypothetical protein
MKALPGELPASRLGRRCSMEIYAGFRPEPAQEFLARARLWINTHTDQVIIVSLVFGFWLVATSIYYIVT